MKDVLTQAELRHLLADTGLVEEKDLVLAEERVKSEGGTFSQALLWFNFISEEDLGKIIADALNVPFVVLEAQDIPEEVLHIIPEVVSKKHCTVAFALDSNGLRIATTHPEERELPDFLEKKTGLPVKVCYATPRDVQNALSRYNKNAVQAFDELISGDLAAAQSNGKETDPPIIRIVDTLVSYAYQNRASDIHIEPREKDMLVRFRIDGILNDIVKLPPTLHPQIIARIKVLAKLPTDEHQTPLDGKIEFILEEYTRVDVRISVIPTTEGEKVVLRLLSERSRQFSLTNLGMQPDVLAKLEEAYKKPYGMVLVTGPTGCGKTTTLYAILKLLNRRDVNIVTIEDPVEYDIEGISQIQVNPAVNLNFSTGLRSILRQDPNVILVGEIRDDETADIAVNLAMTGHIVLSTLHTNNAATTIPRLIDLKIEPFLIASTINIIVAQRLMRKIHMNCRVSEETESEEIVKRIGKEMYEKVFGEVEPERKIRLYRGKGCPACHGTGYEGRVGIFEALIVDDAIREAVVRQENASVIEGLAIASGMRTMFESGLINVQQGLTTIDEVLRATTE